MGTVLCVCGCARFFVVCCLWRCCLGVFAPCLLVDFAQGIFTQPRRLSFGCGDFKVSKGCHFNSRAFEVMKLASPLSGECKLSLCKPWPGFQHGGPHVVAGEGEDVWPEFVCPQITLANVAACSPIHKTLLSTHSKAICSSSFSGLRQQHTVDVIDGLAAKVLENRRDGGCLGTKSLAPWPETAAQSPSPGMRRFRHNDTLAPRSATKRSPVLCRKVCSPHKGFSGLEGPPH